MLTISNNKVWDVGHGYSFLKSLVEIGTTENRRPLQVTIDLELAGERKFVR